MTFFGIGSCTIGIFRRKIVLFGVNLKVGMGPIYRQLEDVVNVLEQLLHKRLIIVFERCSLERNSPHLI